MGLGWEWYTTSLSDHGVSSTRAYTGPTFAALSLAAPRRLSRLFAIGPSLGVRAGVFTGATRTTPAWTDTTLDGPAVHAWLRAALRIKARLARGRPLDEARAEGLARDAADHASAPIDVDFVRAVERPPGGRINAVVFARIAYPYGVPEGTIKRALFPRSRRR